MNHPLWNRWISALKEKVSQKVFEDYFSQMSLIEASADRVRIAVPQGTDFNILNRYYRSLAEFAWFEVSQSPASLEFTEPPKLPELSEVQFLEGLLPIPLNAEFIFDKFVVGSNSSFAQAAALSVATNPGGNRFNPLLIHGGPGLGKTHLLHSIGHFVREKFPEKTVRYIDADGFTREYVDVMKSGNAALMNRFTQFYRNEVDVLLMDDIQFLSGKIQTQEVFFHIFNTLYHAGKQIVMTSDNPPQLVKGIEERLISRFQGGLIVDIQQPGQETREAILRQKAESNRLELADDVIAFISENVDSNVRVLESIIIKLLFQSTMQKGDFNIEMVKKIINQASSATRVNVVKVDDIVELVAKYFSVDATKILESGRGTKEVAQARQIALYLSKELSPLSHKSIGMRFGDRDHSTVVHACKSIEKQLDRDKELKKNIEALRLKLKI